MGKNNEILLVDTYFFRFGCAAIIRISAGTWLGSKFTVLPEKIMSILCRDHQIQINLNIVIIETKLRLGIGNL